MTKWAGKDYPELRDPKQYTSCLWNSSRVIRNAQPVVGFFELVSVLRENRILFKLITSRPNYLLFMTQHWFEKWSGGLVTGEDIIFQKGSEINPNHKKEQIESLGIRLFFEDMIEHVPQIYNRT